MRISIRFHFLFIVVFCLFFIWATDSGAQVSPTGTLTGTVLDPSDAVVAGAKVSVTDEATKARFETISGKDGRFVVANLNAGAYTVRVTAEGFKTSIYRGAQLSVGSVYDLNVQLVIGSVETTVEVLAGTELLDTASTTIGSVVTGKAIVQLPFATRDVTDLAVLEAGAQTPGVPRGTTFLGLHSGAINITYDGINIQENRVKSADGFYMIIRPRIDSVAEFSITTAAQGAEQTGEGAIQIRFETKRGSNEFHGGLWWYHRNDFLNANYYFNNQAGVPREKNLLNQYGYRISGPIAKDRLFFFQALDNYHYPRSASRTRTILSSDALAGRFTYGVNSVPSIPPSNTWTTCAASDPRNHNFPACTVDLARLAAAKGVPYAADLMVTEILTAIDAVRSLPEAGLSVPTSSLWADQVTYNARTMQWRRMPDLRLDWNVTPNVQWTAIYHYQYLLSSPDLLNSLDPTFPVPPFNSSWGNQGGNRNLLVTAVRWNLAANKSNEFRWGLTTGRWEYRQSRSLLPTGSTNLGEFRIRPTFPTSIMSSPFLSSINQFNNSPILQLNDNFHWTRGRHNIAFGGSWTSLRTVDYSFDAGVTSAAIGLVSSDPASALFSITNLPGSGTTARGAAGTLFALLTGRVSTYSGSIAVDENLHEYVPDGPLVTRARMNEFGFYGTDSWRLRPSLTLNYGLRWEFQGATQDPKSTSYRLVNGADALYGVSGPNNMFAPGTLTGSIPTFELNNGRAWYEKDLNNFAPSIGLAWRPGFKNPVWSLLFGERNRAVFRGGYSISFTREGLNNFYSIAFSNAGQTATVWANALPPPSGPCPTGPFTTPAEFPAGCLTLTGLVNTGQLQSLVMAPSSYRESFQITPFANQSVNAHHPGLGVPYVQSWSVGMQRGFTSNTVVEVRYVGNHGTGLWRQFDLNEANIFENGFLDEFLNAQNNLRICGEIVAACLASQAAAGVSSANRTTSTFAYWGLPGQTPLPILTAAFTGSTSGTQTGTNFRSGTYLSYLILQAAGSFANSLAKSLNMMCNLAGSAALPGAYCSSSAPVVGAYPVNFFVVNPHASGAYLFTNSTHSSYNGLQIEFRQHPFKGLMLNANYTFSKSLSNYYASSSTSFAKFNSLHNFGVERGPTPNDLRHAFKAYWIYELPFGPGRKWTSRREWINRFIEQWEFSGTTRWQSGRVFNLQSGVAGTVNQNDSFVELVGITQRQLQDMLGVRKLPDGRVYYFPENLIDPGTGHANYAYLRPCSTPGKFCQRLFFTGPGFFMMNLSVLKRVQVNERANVEFRTEFLNALNRTNFYFGGSASSVATSASDSSISFGRISSAYQDVTNSQDPGGRIVQMVLRINF